jgi:DNA-binding NtrC family response regulator
MTGTETTTLDPSEPSFADGSSSKVMGIAWGYPELRFMPLLGQAMKVGRAESCEGRLCSKQVSRKHALIKRAGRAWLLSDANSRNGVYHNGLRVDEVVLSEGDVLRIGDWVGTVVAADQSTTPGGPVPPIAVAGVRTTELLRQAHVAAASELSILLLGETGTGKDVVARAIHEWSGRPGAFVPINCATLTESLAESLLFGHKRGAFTGADREATGFFVEAHDGTLLLDEICDLSAAVQAKLLRVLEERMVTPVGSTKPLAVNVRVIAAAHPDLVERVDDGRFRADLYARLRGLELEVPPLRERREELVPLFIHHLKSEWNGEPPEVQPELLEHLLLRDWPLNVRDVVQVARQMAVLHSGTARLTVRHLPPSVTQRSSNSPPASVSREVVAQRWRRSEQADATRRRELDKLLGALQTHGGNVSRAASALGMQRRQAYRLLELRPDLDLARYRGRCS